jgi:serine/threonine-protein kinase RsbW
MQQVKNIKLTTDMENLAQLMSFISEYAGGQGLAPNKIDEIQLAIEEAFVNICGYAYAGGKGEVQVNCFSEIDHFVIEIIDSGVPFDITTQELPNITTDIHERKPGGLGCLLIRKFIDTLTYRRDNGKNILTLTMFLQ